MKQTTTNAFTGYLQGKYDKAQQRLERAMASGRFAQFTQRKKAQLLNRLSRYARQLGMGMKQSLVAAGIAAGLTLATPSVAQTFTVQIGAANPFNGVSVGSFSAPTFVDVDNDGDKDAFIGESGGTIKYYKNTGTAAAPVFTAQTGAANPFNGVDVGDRSTPTFVDIDNDGDKDAFIGESGGTIKYYKNTGTAAAPVFTAQTGAANPFNGVDVGSYSTPTFVDIDNDGDKDAFVGEESFGLIKYYKNTGTVTAPVFTEQTGAANPFNGMGVGRQSTPTFEDIDNDGDKDAFIGEYAGFINYYKNTGTVAAPVFTEQTDVANPFIAVSTGSYRLAPAFVDIDNDGDKDLFIGEEFGSIQYFKNAPLVLPVELVSFSGKYTEGGNHLTWQTANEVNNKGFQVERHIGGSQQATDDSWETVGFVAAKGKSATYTFTDDYRLSPVAYYRLKQVDNDGKFEYSKVISIAQTSEGKGLSIYPNPVSNILNLNYTEGSDFQILNLLGQQVLSGTPPYGGRGLDVSALAKGTYILKVGTEQAKFIKQ